jgi:hypothetical protein
VFAGEFGCVVEDITPAWSKLVLNFPTLIAADSDLVGMRALAERLGLRLSMTLRRFLQIEWSAEMLTKAGKFRKSVTNQMWRLMSRFDYLLTPTTNDLPSPADKPDGADDFVRPLPVFTCIANMTGQPALRSLRARQRAACRSESRSSDGTSPIATYWRSPPRSSGRVRGGNTGRNRDGASSGRHARLGRRLRWARRKVHRSNIGKERR